MNPTGVTVTVKLNFSFNDFVILLMSPPFSEEFNAVLEAVVEQFGED